MCRFQIAVSFFSFSSATASTAPRSDGAGRADRAGGGARRRATPWPPKAARAIAVFIRWRAAAARAPDQARACGHGAADSCLRCRQRRRVAELWGRLRRPGRSQQHGSTSRVPLGCAFPRAREGGASASGFDPAAPARSYGDCSARADRNRWPRGGCGVCALWHFRLGDRALIRGRAGAERRAANPGRRCWPTARPAAVFCLGLGDRRWRSSSATAARNSWPQGSLRMCSHSVGFWNRPSATAP